MRCVLQNFHDLLFELIEIGVKCAFLTGALVAGATFDLRTAKSLIRECIREPFKYFKHTSFTSLCGSERGRVRALMKLFVCIGLEAVLHGYIIGIPDGRCCVEWH
jgi:hypothetical protein